MRRVVRGACERPVSPGGRGGSVPPRTPAVVGTRRCPLRGTSGEDGGGVGVGFFLYGWGCSLSQASGGGPLTFTAGGAEVGVVRPPLGAENSAGNQRRHPRRASSPRSSSIWAPPWQDVSPSTRLALAGGSPPHCSRSLSSPYHISPLSLLDALTDSCLSQHLIHPRCDLCRPHAVPRRKRGRRRRRRSHGGTRIPPHDGRAHRRHRP